MSCDRYMSIQWWEGPEQKDVTINDFVVVPPTGASISVGVAPSKFVELVVEDVLQWFEYGAQRVTLKCRLKEPL